MLAIGVGEVVIVVIMPSVTKETRSPTAGLALSLPAAMRVPVIGTSANRGNQNGLNLGENHDAVAHDRAEKVGQTESHESAEVPDKDDGHGGQVVSNPVVVPGNCKGARNLTIADVTEVLRETAAVTPTVVTCPTEGYIVALCRAEITTAQNG